MKKYFVFYFPIINLIFNSYSLKPCMKNNNSKYEYSEEGNCQIQGEIIPLAIVTIKNRITKRKVSDETRKIDIFST